ncbi:MAG: S8 family serine peptidase [Candidatus Kapaibacterium sp.]
MPRYILIFGILCFNLYSLEAFQDNDIIIKFTGGSYEYSEWLQSGRSGSIGFLDDIIGNHQTLPAVNSDIINTLNKKADNSLAPLPSNKYSHLLRICVIRPDRPLNSALMASKLSAYEFIEYAEPAPKRYFSEIPDDPLFDDQYYISKINTISAWDSIPKGSDEVLLAIVDTGVDYLHEDLDDNIWFNPGETGIDSFGFDKSTNGVDDDGNGFIDDWRGWDFAGENGFDNDPMPGHLHGTHVAGISAAISDNATGITGIAIRTKIIPVKVGRDDPFSKSVVNAYDGILYAAAVGADVINCSWGGSAFSQSEQEVINTALDAGCVVVGAAGNNYSNQAFYPAGYKGVMSVAAVNRNDFKADFSNFHPVVDVSAPGIGILSTIPGNDYTPLDGTSMASPVAAGVACLVKLKHRDYNSEQVIEHIKATSDNIYDRNRQYTGLLGRGRVNAFSAVTAENPRSLIMENYRFEEEIPNGIFEPGERIDLYIKVKNVLGPLELVGLQAESPSPNAPEFIEDIINFGNLNTGEAIEGGQPVTFILPEKIPVNYKMEFIIEFFARGGYKHTEAITFIVNPSYRTMDENNLSVTFNNRGNIAFNDFPDNAQGEGFKYKGGSNLLYEGALMVATGRNRVSNTARGSSGSPQDDDFFSDGVFTLLAPGNIADMEGRAEYSDTNDENQAGVAVMQEAFQFKDEDKKDFILISYDLINNTGVYVDSLFAGIYLDWDIGPAGANNLIRYDELNNYGYTERYNSNEFPLTAAALLTNQKLNFFAMDNNGSTPDNPGVYDEFTDEEKYQVLTSGIARKQSSITDASMVIGGGPIRIDGGDTIRLAFALFAADTKQQLDAVRRQAAETAAQFELDESPFGGIPELSRITNIYPNPGYGIVSIEYELNDRQNIKLLITDLSGKIIDIILNRSQLPGRKTISFNTGALKLTQGAYYIILETEKAYHVKNLIIVE